MSGVTLFRETLETGFGDRLGDHPAFAGRMLPVSAEPPREFSALVSSDLSYVTSLLAPGHRRRAEALALLRPYALSDRAASTDVQPTQPTDQELSQLASRLAQGIEWRTALPGLARLSFDSASPLTYELRITRNAVAPPVVLLSADDPNAENASGILEVDVLNRYPFYAKDLAPLASVNRYDIAALVHYLDLRSDPTSYRLVTVGSQEHHRYSHKALREVRRAVAVGRLDEARATYARRSTVD